MKTKINCSLLLSLLAFSLNAQVLPQLKIKNELQPRMEKALEKARSYPVPEWCNSDELLKKRDIIIQKAIKTLYNNYLSPINRIRYESVMPSPSIYNGLWSWDSWKHSAGLAYIDPELAKNSIRAMYDYQYENGFVPDCVFPDTNNFTGSTCVEELTKPPLTGWAVWEIYEQTHDISFVAEMMPKIIKYHEWRYEDRDINKNGLCELGAGVNRLSTASCEMADMAIRYDDAKLIKKSDKCYSMNTEPVDLSAYMYQEKEFIVKMAKLIGDKKTEKRFKKEAKELKKQIQKHFYDENTGFFYDTWLEDGSFILSQESNGWTPLFAGAATKKQAKRVIANLLDENKFNTPLPLPTASKDNPKFDGEKGYWRGAVWLDQFYFGYDGMLKYGYKEEAYTLLRKLIMNTPELSDPNKELRENYNPFTGEGTHVSNFGWTASHLLMLMLQE